MSASTSARRATDVSRGRAFAGAIGALLLGPLCYALWVAPFGGRQEYIEPWGYAAFFITPAVAGLIIGAVAVRGGRALWVLAGVSWVSIMGTTYWWWSVDVTGLFMVGIIMLTVPVLLGALAFIWLGSAAGVLIDRRRPR